MEKEKSNSIFDIKEADPILEKHRKDVLEKYIEYDIALIHKFKDERKNLDDLLEHKKKIIWFVKNERAQQIQKEFGNLD